MATNRPRSCLSRQYPNRRIPNRLVPKLYLGTHALAHTRSQVALGNALVREIVFREHRGLDYESEYTAQGRKVQLRLQLRYEIQFRNEPCLTVTLPFRFSASWVSRGTRRRSCPQAYLLSGFPHPHRQGKAGRHPSSLSGKYRPF